MMPAQQGYPVAAPAVAEVAEAPQNQKAEIAVKLPDPADTGAKPAAPPAAAAGGAPKKEEKPSNTAADIIKQYMNRRS